jgi:hypothetical protein
MKTLNQWRSFCKSLINKSLLKLTALNKVFLSAVVLCLALLSAPVALAAETPKLNSGSSIDGNEMLLMAIAPSIRPPLQGISPGPARQASVMNGKMGRTGGAAAAEAAQDVCSETAGLPGSLVSQGLDCVVDGGVTYYLDAPNADDCLTGQVVVLNETACEDIIVLFNLGVGVPFMFDTTANFQVGCVFYESNTFGAIAVLNTGSPGTPYLAQEGSQLVCINPEQ